MPTLNAAALLTAWEQGTPQHPVQRALTLLVLAWPEKSADEWARSSIGERDGHLLRLRNELFGSKLEATAICPKCGERLEFTFSTDEVRTEAAGSPSKDGGLRLEAYGHEVDYRLPTSADLLEIADCRAGQEAKVLLKRCIALIRSGGAVVDLAALPDQVVKAVIEQMGKADPQADVQIGLACPSCLHRWSMVFDIFSYLWSEIEDWARRLLIEIHSLASAYGWSERDIVAMSAKRRRHYLEMLGA